jgi:hypothetical protein
MQPKSAAPGRLTVVSFVPLLVVPIQVERVRHAAGQFNRPGSYAGEGLAYGLSETGVAIVIADSNVAPLQRTCAHCARKGGTTRPSNWRKDCGSSDRCLTHSLPSQRARDFQCGLARAGPGFAIVHQARN